MEPKAKQVREKVERARRFKAVNTKGAHASIHTSDMPQPVSTPGSRVVIDRGDVCDDACTTTMEKVDGKRARVDGIPYVAVGGPNKGKILQPVRVEGSNSLVSVPTDRLHRETGSRSASRPKVGWTRAYESGWDRVFGNR